MNVVANIYSDDNVRTLVVPNFNCTGIELIQGM